MQARAVRVLVVLAALVAGPRLAAADTLDQNCQAGALFASVECRIGAVLDWVSGSTSTPVKVRNKLTKLATGAENKVKAAQHLSDRHRNKPAYKKLRQVDHTLQKVQDTLNGLSPTGADATPRALPSTATPAEVANYVQGIRTDVTGIRINLGDPVGFATICCLRICEQPPTSSGGCVVVDSIPCSDYTCLATAGCLAEGCLIVPIPKGVTCADALPECTESATCPAINPNCVVP